jgi:RNA polymerase sigma factor (sigma-70 family)
MNDPFLQEYEFDLRSYCRMLTGTPWDAEDLYQETMLKALKAEGKFLLHPSPKALLFRIASNAWIDECRKRKADVSLPDEYLATYVDFGAVKAALHRARKQLIAAAQMEASEDTVVKRKSTEEQSTLIQKFQRQKAIWLIC